MTIGNSGRGSKKGQKPISIRREESLPQEQSSKPTVMMSLKCPRTHPLLPPTTTTSFVFENKSNDDKPVSIIVVKMKVSLGARVSGNVNMVNQIWMGL